MCVRASLCVLNVYLRHACDAVDMCVIVSLHVFMYACRKHCICTNVFMYRCKRHKLHRVKPLLRDVLRWIPVPYRIEYRL